MYSRLQSNCKPYHQVTQKNNFKWGPEQQEAFEQIKQDIIYAVALVPERTGQIVENMPSLCGQGEWSLMAYLAKSTWRNEYDFWGSGFGDTEDLWPATPQLRKRLWQLMKGLGLPGYWH